jgi:thiosulfate/3-mercaptopyruvate sulfurtransferase
MTGPAVHLDRYRFVDCRFDLADHAAGGRRSYVAGHVPGAAFLDLDTDLSDRSRPGGRNPLPSAETFGAAAARAGIDARTFVVVYDDGASGAAYRCWWLLRHFGHDAAAVLAGGLEAWQGPLRSGEEEIEPATFVPRERRDDTIEVEELLDRLGEPGLALVDTRSDVRFAAGHRPGARSVPLGTPLPEDVHDAPSIVLYCGSGVSACSHALALQARGRADARLYVGSWTEWSALDLPTER